MEKDKEKKPTKRQIEAGQKHVERVRKLCLALPETWEKISHVTCAKPGN